MLRDDDGKGPWFGRHHRGAILVVAAAHERCQDIGLGPLVVVRGSVVNGKVVVHVSHVVGGLGVSDIKGGKKAKRGMFGLSIVQSYAELNAVPDLDHRSDPWYMSLDRQTRLLNSTVEEQRRARNHPRGASQDKHLNNYSLEI